MKNLLTLHEAMVVALISNKDRESSFAQVAEIIKRRNLFPERKGNITLEDQIKKLRTLPSGKHHDLFEVHDDRIKLKIT